MPNISQDLQAIMDARYGRDVRQSIHDAIYDINEVCDENVSTVQGITDDAEGFSETSEAYAKGTVNGTPVSSGQIGFQDNSKYYSTQASNSASSASNSASTATSKAILSESWAEGGTDSRTGEDTANSKYWANQSLGYANQASSTLATIRAETAATTFSVNMTTGQIEYTSPNYTFSINTTTGQMEWEVA